MILVDVNVIVYAAMRSAVDHVRYRAWLERSLEGDEPVAVSDVVLSGFVRVVTNPRVFRQPLSTTDAFAFADRLRGQPNVITIAPGPRHWEIFRRLCNASAAKGNLVADAYLAALAIEAGCEWVTTDRDFARFEGLRWSHPLAS